MVSRDWTSIIQTAILGGIAYAIYLFWQKLPKSADLARAGSEMFNLMTSNGVQLTAEVKFPDGRLVSMNELLRQGARTKFVGNVLHLTIGGGEWIITGRDALGRYLLQAVIT